MKTSGIYKIINKINGKYYVGSSKDLQYRWHMHRNDLIHNRHGNSHLQNAWNKYGKDNFYFEKIKEVETNKLLEEEQKYLNEIEKNPSVSYNHQYDATGGKFSLISRQKMSERRRGKGNAFYGKHHTNETKKILSDIALKRDPSKHPWIGRKHTEKSKEKISLKNKGNYSGKLNPAYKSDVYTFYNSNTDEIFIGGLFDFCKKYILNKGNVSWLIKGKNKSVKGWIIKK